MNDLSFLNEMESKSGENISGCYQCYRCTNGCPVAADMDIYPHKVIRHIILGDREKVLTSKAFWTCLQCTTCSVRCPNDIDIARVFDTLRKVSVAEHKEAEKDTWGFYSLFLDSVKRHGRLHEVEAMAGFILKKGDLINAAKDNAKMGFGMFTKGRIGLLPHNIKDRKGLKEMFRKTEAEKAKR